MLQTDLRHSENEFRARETDHHDHDHDNHDRRGKDHIGRLVVAFMRRGLRKARYMRTQHHGAHGAGHTCGRYPCHHLLGRGPLLMGIARLAEGPVACPRGDDCFVTIGERQGKAPFKSSNSSEEGYAFVVDRLLVGTSILLPSCPVTRVTTQVLASASTVLDCRT